MLKAYIRAIVQDTLLAEDTLSDVILEIGRAWERFDRSRPVELWARGIVRRVALANLRKQGRQPVLLDEEVLEQIGETLDKAGDETQLEFRKEVLHRCLQRLSMNNMAGSGDTDNCQARAAEE